MFSIQQTADGWVLRAGDETVSEHETYDEATVALAALLGEPSDDSGARGELPDRWHSTTGIAFSEQPDPERDFTDVEWSHRDPAVYRLPLMFQTSTDMGHFGAQLAGFIDGLEVRDGTVFAEGGFYDSEAGRAFRDVLSGGHRFGVSVDPDPQATEAEFECTEEDDEGFCTDGVVRFTSYRVAGLTGTPFPAFPNATIELAGADLSDEVDDETDPEAEPVAASAAWDRLAGPTPEVLAAPVAPPRAWFEMPEPGADDERLIEQPDGTLAVPLTITDDGQIYGHLARWGQCHVAYPGGPSVCTSPPKSPSGYAAFHLGTVRTEEGDDLPVGPLFVGCDHPALSLSAPEARDAYANTGAAWADVRIVDGEFGPWVAGALRPYVSELQIRLLRASSLSGDWRPPEPGADHLEAIAVLAVTTPGFPVHRHAKAIAAAAGTVHALPTREGRLRARTAGDRLLGLVASSTVRRCPSCDERADTEADVAAMFERLEAELLPELAALKAEVRTLNRRTQHLSSDAAAGFAARVQRGRGA